MANKYEWRPGMGQISGFGGAYEDACRTMVRNGCEWFDAHPDAKPTFSGYKDTFGICLSNNEDANALSAAICGDIEPSGAMHQAAVQAVLFIKENSWEEYVRRKTEAQTRRDAAAAATTAKA